MDNIGPLIWTVDYSDCVESSPQAKGIYNKKKILSSSKFVTYLNLGFIFSDSPKFNWTLI